MIIPIVYTSAIQFWLNYNARFNQIQNGSFTITDLPEIYDFQVKHETAKQIAESLNLTFPLSLMHPAKNERRVNNLFYSVKRPISLPKNSFVEVFSLGSVRILVATPELCFLQAACILDLRRLVMLGTELCGIYLYDDNAEFKQRSRNPVTNIEKIIDYLKRADYCYGREKALRATHYILDCSNSRMESMLATMSTLPISQGGHSLRRASMNALLHFSEEGNKMVNGRKCYGDVVWEKEKVVIEYDSDISHLSASQHALDKNRVNAMTVSGYKVITFTSQDAFNLARIDNKLKSVRKALGMHSANQKLEQYVEKRRELLGIFRTFRCNDPSTYPKSHRKKRSKKAWKQTKR